jgi:microcystin-dependent protein
MECRYMSIAKNIIAAFLVVAALVGASVYAPTPAISQFVDQSTYAGTSAGSANAQTVTLANWSSNLTGVKITFVPGNTNTGPTTLNVNGVGAVNVVRPSSIGNVNFSGAEFTAGELTCVVFNGTAWQLACNVDPRSVGAIIEFRGTVAPRGTLMEDGSCVSQTTYAALFTVIGTTYGSCSAGQFAVPDSRGTVFAAQDNQGVNGSAGRITSAGGCDTTAGGLILCGAQARVWNIANLSPFTPTTSSFSLATASSAIGAPPVRQFTTATPTNDSTHLSLGNSTGTDAGTFSIAIPSASVTGTITMNSLGSSTPALILPPMLVGRRSIKY